MSLCLFAAMGLMLLVATPPGAEVRTPAWVASDMFDRDAWGAERIVSSISKRPSEVRRDAKTVAPAPTVRMAAAPALKVAA